VSEAAPENIGPCCCGANVEPVGAKHWWALKCPACGYSTPRFFTRGQAVKAHGEHIAHTAALRAEIARLQAWLDLGSTRAETLFGRGLEAAECAKARAGGRIGK